MGSTSPSETCFAIQFCSFPINNVAGRDGGFETACRQIAMCRGPLARPAAAKRKPRDTKIRGAPNVEGQTLAQTAATKPRDRESRVHRPLRRSASRRSFGTATEQLVPYNSACSLPRRKAHVAPCDSNSTLALRPLRPSHLGLSPPVRLRRASPHATRPICGTICLPLGPVAQLVRAADS